MTPQDDISRREFVASAATLTSGLALSGCAADQPAQPGQRPLASQHPIIVSTWRFGKPANEKALEVLQQGRSLLDAVVEGIGGVESDPSVDSVGVGGLPNAEGVVSLDACIVDGRTHKCGSVAALEGIEHPIAVARGVMEQTRHVMLVGAGAETVRVEPGISRDQSAHRGVARKVAAMESRSRRNEHRCPPGNPRHDRPGDRRWLTVVWAGGCSTSGLAWKLPGRVGDSPIIGSGLYVDNDVGAAGATGVGENVMRFCGSFQVVELMRQGADPQEACLETIRRIQKKHAAGADLAINFIALDKQGRYRGRWHEQGLGSHGVCHPGFSALLRPAATGPPRTGHGGAPLTT